MRAYSIAISAVVSSGVALAGCDRAPPGPFEYRSEQFVMGTKAAVTSVAPAVATARHAAEAAYARIHEVNRLMSDYVDDSEIGRLNKLVLGESLVVAPETFTCLQHAAEISAASDGAFDVTCRPLVRLWRRAGTDGRLPGPTELDAVRARVGWRHLELDADTRRVTPAVAGMQIDLGGIAKGYALDLAAEAMQAAGATGGLVDIGGDIRAFGRRTNGTPWRIGVRDPFKTRDAEPVRVLALTDAAVATSGVQERFIEIDGRRYSHIIDPRTGRPAEQAPSVTVIAPTGWQADAWATVFSVLTLPEGQALLESQSPPGVAVLWITWADPEATSPSDVPESAAPLDSRPASPTPGGFSVPIFTFSTGFERYVAK